ncbi:polysaccharide deacetylase [Candidatus Parcubacteria bacterium]|nr:MAG: polysaccharide deacetylase [Candidatus Parcubacteria bacterium]
MSLKHNFNKINFFFGRNPRVEKRSDWKKFIPNSYKAVVTITADFELAWGWRYSKSSTNPLKKAIQKARLERENIPKILQLSEEFNIPITWATVGHLFLENCEVEEDKPHSSLPRLNHFENDFWRFNGTDWFEHDTCSDYKSTPEWYCPDLLFKILNSKIEHEIGCHTFSHIDCRDEICSKEVFDSEIIECKKIASVRGIELNSFVHPGHTIGNLNNLAKLGFSSYQTDPGNVLGYPVKHKNGLWELKRTYEFVYKNDWSIDYHIYRYKKIIERALKSNTVCNFWFHPSFDFQFVSQVLPSIFENLNLNKSEIFISTVTKYLKRIS